MGAHKLTMIFFMKDELTTYNRKYEIIKNENIHIHLLDEVERWTIIETRFKVLN